jgi:hypothetical protein
MALTANREINRYVDQELRSYRVAGGAHVFKGALVGVNRTTGFARPTPPGCRTGSGASASSRRATSSCRW